MHNCLLGVDDCLIDSHGSDKDRLSIGHLKENPVRVHSSRKYNDVQSIGHARSYHGIFLQKCQQFIYSSMIYCVFEMGKKWTINSNFFVISKQNVTRALTDQSFITDFVHRFVTDTVSAHLLTSLAY